jgi:signal transduction histidine kinase
VWAEIVSARIPFGGREAILIAGTDVTERIRAEKEREAASRQIVLAQEREQRSIARELHDQIGQMLTALKLMLETSDQRGHLGREGLAKVKGLVDQLMERVRGLTLNLRPPVLDRFGLLPALLGLVKRFTHDTPLQVDFVHCGLERRFSSAIETAAFRIVQEALTNIARHAAVHRAVVRVFAGVDALTLQVEDTGVGFDIERASTGDGTVGLIGMRERASTFGGQLTIESSPGCGTKIHAELPIDGEEQKYDDDDDRHRG